MFKDLLGAFRDQGLMKEAMGEFSTMLKDARWMFDTIGRSLLEGSDPKEHRQELYARDIRLNQAERAIRKKVVEHLGLSSRSDLGASLVMFSVAKDAERLGDYCKNLQEIADFKKDHTFPERYVAEIATMHRSISRLMEATERSFVAADAVRARAVMDEIRTMGKRCDKIVQEMIETDDQSDARGAVIATLTVRYLKRVAAHLSNIASGVVNPVHKIDFYKPDDPEQDQHD